MESPRGRPIASDAWLFAITWEMTCIEVAQHCDTWPVHGGAVEILRQRCHRWAVIGQINGAVTRYVGRHVSPRSTSPNARPLRFTLTFAARTLLVTPPIHRTNMNPYFESSCEAGVLAWYIRLAEHVTNVI